MDERFWHSPQSIGHFGMTTLYWHSGRGDRSFPGSGFSYIEPTSYTPLYGETSPCQKLSCSRTCQQRRLVNCKIVNQNGASFPRQGPRWEGINCDLVLIAGARSNVGWMRRLPSSRERHGPLSSPASIPAAAQLPVVGGSVS